MKHCSECDKDLPNTDFGVNRQAKDGLDYYCKPCKRMRNRQWFKANPEQFRAAKHRYYEKVKGQREQSHAL